MVLECSFNGKTCDFQRDFKWHHNYKYGNCYTFNPGYDRKDSPASDSNNYWEIKSGNLPPTATRTDYQRPIYMSTRVTDTYGLKMLLNTDIVRYSKNTPATGWKVTSNFFF